MNETGEMLATRILRGAAVHISRGEQTLQHAHYAWKIHIGLDAPVWLDSDRLHVSSGDGARVIVIPPGLEHRVGAIGWSCAVFVAPGTRDTPWGPTAPVSPIGGAHAQRILDACASHEGRADTPHLVSEITRLVFEPVGTKRLVDLRARRALTRLAHDPNLSLAALASDERLSLDRLSHLVVRDTGTSLRRHALWSRLMKFLSSNKRYPSLAAAALDAGFADHAHMTRTYRALLGRLPSEFDAPPDALEPWSTV